MSKENNTEDFKPKKSKMKKVSKIMDTVWRIVLYIALLALLIYESNFLCTIGWFLMIAAEVMGNIPDIQKVKYKGGKILTMIIWIIGIFVYAVFWN